MFYVTYVRNELVRRRARTIVTLLGLGVGVALVIAIASLSDGLDRAQKQTLDPLAGIGTDITVTLTPQQDQSTGFGGPGGGRGGNRDLVQANQSVITDLSQLGKPGEHFVHDFFLPGSQLTFKQSAASQITKIDGVAQVAAGLTLLAQHQEGVVPKIVAKLKTGGQTFDIRRNLPRPTAAQFQKMQACIDKLRAQSGGSGANGGGLGGGGGGFGGGGGGNGGPGPRGVPEVPAGEPAAVPHAVHDAGADAEAGARPAADQHHDDGVHDRRCRPDEPDMGVVTESQVTKGRFLAPAGGKEALVSGSYAAKHSLKVGSKLDLNGTSFTVVGIVSPPLGGQTADVYLPLKQLQTLAKQTGLANVVLVRASDSCVGREGAEGDPDRVAAGSGRELEAGRRPDQRLTRRRREPLAQPRLRACDRRRGRGVPARCAATLSSVGKRVRELGTLKALGWTQWMVVRQVAGESLATGVVGGALGIVLGVLAALAIDAFGPTLTASSSTAAADNLLGLGSAAARTATSTVSLDAPLAASVLALGFGLALLGGLIAGTAGALRAARLRPADALRQAE